MGVPTGTYSWAGGLRRIERRGGTEEFPLERIHVLQKSFHLMSLSLPVDGSEQRKVSFHRFSKGGINRLGGWSRDSEKLANKNRERKIAIK